MSFIYNLPLPNYSKSQTHLQLIFPSIKWNNPVKLNKFTTKMFLEIIQQDFQGACR